MVGALPALEHGMYDTVAKIHFDNHHGKPKQLKKRTLQTNGWRAAFSVTLPGLGGKACFSTSNLTPVIQLEVGKLDADFTHCVGSIKNL